MSVNKATLVVPDRADVVASHVATAALLRRTHLGRLLLGDPLGHPVAGLSENPGRSATTPCRSRDADC